MDGTPERLTSRRLNRALLHRQQLLERSEAGLVEVVERMGGIQMQYAPSGYVALWSRMGGFARPMLTRALEERSVIQGTLMRGTIHTVSTADYWPMRAGVRRVIREWYTRSTARELAGIDIAAAARTARELLADGPMRFVELAAAMEARGFPMRATKAVGFWIDLVRVPPSGTWDARRADLYGLSEWWIPPVEMAEDEGIEHLVRRYLGAFGPAPLHDIASWMGLKAGQVRHVTDRMDFVMYRDEAGQPLLDLPDGTLPEEGTPAPPRFIGTWEAMLLVHARRTQVLPEAYRPLVFKTKTPHSVNTFLLDGQVAGTWRFEGDEIRLDPFRRLRSPERALLEAEAHGLAALHAE